jgi:Amt family ammonium transporter
VAVTGAYSFVGSYIILYVLKYFHFPLRVSEKEEEAGLDQSAHGETGYRLL